MECLGPDPPVLDEPTEKLPSLAEWLEGAPYPVPVFAALDLAEFDGGGIPFPLAGGSVWGQLPYPSPSCLEDGAGAAKGLRLVWGNRLEAPGDLGGGEMLLKK